MASRKPSYAAPSRLALLMLTLAATPNGVPVDAIDELLGVSERTRHRYLRLLRGIFGAHLDTTDHAVTLRAGWKSTFAYPEVMR